MSLQSNPIALFDSGSGGLAVLKHLEKRLPNESILYVGDLIHMPYGEKSPDSIKRYCLNIALFLQDLGAKFLLVGCNTASGVALEDLKKHLNIPVLGLIEPCAKKAATLSKGRIGILATQASIRSRSYEKALLQFAPQSTLIPAACPTLAYLLEQGLANHQATPFVVKAALQKFILAGIDTLVLGCSHYPLILDVIQNSIDAEIVDSSETCIDEVVTYLEANDLLNRTSRRSVRFFTSAFPEAFQKVAPAFLGREIEKPEHYQHPKEVDRG